MFYRVSIGELSEYCILERFVTLRIVTVEEVSVTRVILVLCIGELSLYCILVE